MNREHKFKWKVLKCAPKTSKRWKNLEASIISINAPSLKNQLEIKILTLFRHGLTRIVRRTSLHFLKVKINKSTFDFLFFLFYYHYFLIKIYNPFHQKKPLTTASKRSPSSSRSPAEALTRHENFEIEREEYKQAFSYSSYWKDRRNNEGDWGISQRSDCKSSCNQHQQNQRWNKNILRTVSYTHLTLPTKA